MSTRKTVSQEKSGVRNAEKSRKEIQKKRNEYRDIKSKAAEKFCSHLKYLINCLYVKNKRDDEVIQLRERLNIAARTNALLVIETAGPFFMQYRKEISGRNAEFFMNADFTGDIAKSTGNKVEETPEVVVKMRNTWSEYKQSEKEDILKKIAAMLKYVATFMKADKSLRNM